MAGLGDIIKEELLKQQIKAPCCKNSFICGTEVFAKSRKNTMTDAVQAYKARLARVKQKKPSFFDEEIALGYLIGQKDGKPFPVSSERKCPSCGAHLVRGAFLVCGRASVSRGEIHIEMALPDDESVKFFSELLFEVDIPVKQTVRRGERLIYIKKHEVAADFLAYIGAVKLSFNMMQDLILNQRRSRAIRQTNCDAKNIVKAVMAASEHIKAIDAIIEHGAFDELPLSLRETAMLRRQNPSDSLEALAALHENGISRSGVNHRLAKITELAIKKGYIKE